MTKTPPTIPIEIASRNTPSSFICCKCAIIQADFFVTNDSLENTTEVVPLCFQCYVHKRKWKWRVVKEKKRKIAPAVIFVVIVGIAAVIVAIAVSWKVLVL